jgi:hypothetical protein
VGTDATPAAPTPDSAVNVLRAIVRRASYLGSTVDYQVEVEGTDVALRVTAPVSLRLRPGDPVSLAIAPAACVALPGR